MTSLWIVLAVLCVGIATAEQLGLNPGAGSNLTSPCEYLGLSGVQHQTRQEGTYFLLRETCHSRVAYEGESGASYIYYVIDDSWSGWMVGSEFCVRYGSLSVADDSEWPQNTRGPWREAYLSRWIPSNDVELTCGRAAPRTENWTQRVTSFFVALLSVGFVICLISYACKRTGGRCDGGYHTSSCCLNSVCCRSSNESLQTSTDESADADNHASTGPFVVTLTPPSYEEVAQPIPCFPYSEYPWVSGCETSHFNHGFEELDKLSSNPPPAYDEVSPMNPVTESRDIPEIHVQSDNSMPPPPYTLSSS